MSSLFSRLLHKCAEPLLTVLIRATNKEINSKYFIYFITFIGYLQLAGLCMVNALPDESLTMDTAFLTVIKWSDYLQLLDTYAPDQSTKLYIAVSIQVVASIIFLHLVIANYYNAMDGILLRVAGKIQGIFQQIYVPIFMIPSLKSFFSCLFDAKVMRSSAIIAGCFVWWPIVYAYYTEQRFRIINDIDANRVNHKKIGLFSYLYLLTIIGLTVFNQLIDSTSVASERRPSVTAICAVSIFCAGLQILSFFRDMCFRKRIFGNFILICTTTWISLALFVYLRMYEGIRDLIYIILILAVVLGYSLFKINEYHIHRIIFSKDFEELSENHFDFMVREIYHIFKRAESGHIVSKHLIVVFVEQYIQLKYHKLSHDPEYKCHSLETATRYDVRISTATGKDFFNSNLKVLILDVLDQMYKKKLAQNTKGMSYRLTIGYLSLLIRLLKNGIKASKILVNYHEKVAKDHTLSPIDKYGLDTLQNEMKQLITKRMNDHFSSEADYAIIVEFHQLLEETKSLLMSILQRYGGLFNLLLNKTIDLDKLLKDGQSLVKDKAILEANFRKIFAINILNRESYFLYRTYLFLDVSTTQIEGLGIMENRMVEHNAKNIRILNEELSKKINTFAKDTGVMYISLYEKRLGKILKCTPDVVRLFGYEDAEMKYLEVESLQPICIASVHKDILTKRLNSTKKIKEPFVVPGINKQKFVIPITMVLKLEQFGQELCAAAFMYKKYIPHDLLVIDQMGYLLNYTESFHMHIQAPQRKRSLYGFHIATFLPKLIEVFFEQYKSYFEFDSDEGAGRTRTSSYMRKDSKTGSEEQVTDSKLKIGELTTGYLFIPALPERIEDMETVFAGIAKTYNAMTPNKYIINKSSHALDLFLRATEALLVKSTSTNVRVYQVSFILNHSKKSYNGAELSYYTLEVHNITHVSDQKVISTELFNFRQSIQNAKLLNHVSQSESQKQKTGATTIAGKTGFRPMGTTLRRTEKTSESAESNPRFTKNYELPEQDRINESPREANSGDEEERENPKVEEQQQKQVEISAIGEGPNEDEEEEEDVPRRVNIQVDKNQMIEVSYQKSSQDNDAPNDDSFENNLTLKMLQLGQMMKDEEFFTESEAAAKSSKRSRPQTEEDEERRAPSTHRMRNTLNTDKLTSSQNWRELLKSPRELSPRQETNDPTLGLMTSPRNETNAGLMTSPRNDEMVPLSSNRALLKAQTDGVPKQKFFISANARMASLQSQNLNKNTSAEMPKEVPPLSSKETSSKKKKSYRVEHEETEENEIRNWQQSQSSQQTRSSNQMYQYHQMIFDQTVPSFLTHFDIFGTLAFGILLFLISLLFFLLTQLFTQYEGYLAIGTYPNFMLTPFIWFFAEGERILMQNDGLLDQDDWTTEQFYDTIRVVLQAQYETYRKWYINVPMNMNVEEISSSFYYSDMAFTIYEPNLDIEGSVTPVDNFSYTGATVRLMSFMEAYLAADVFGDITNTTSFIVYIRENFNGYFHAFAEATSAFFEDLYGENRAIDVQKFSQVSLGMSLGILFVFMAAIYPLYRKNEDIQIKILSLFGTFGTGDLERKLAKFKTIYTLLTSSRDGFMPNITEHKTKRVEKAGGSSKRVVSSWTKKRANTFSLAGLLILLYGLMAIYFIIDSTRVASQNNAFVPLSSEFDLSTDVYSYLPTTMGIAYSEINLYKLQHRPDKVLEILGNYNESKTAIAGRVTDLTAHFGNIEEFIATTLMTDEYATFLRRLRKEDICDLVAEHSTMNQTEIDFCKSLGKGLSGYGLSAIFDSYQTDMVTYTSIVESTGFTRENAHTIANSQDFGDYHELGKYCDQIFQIWVDIQTDNANAALDTQQKSAIESFIGGVAMLVGVYVLLWRTFIRIMKRRFINTKLLFSLIPADMLLSNNYVKKFLRDREKVTA